MDPVKRPPLSSIENVGTIPSAEEIELREISEPLLSTHDAYLTPALAIDETTPLSINDDDVFNEQNEVEIRPATDDEGGLHQRRRSSRLSNRSNERRRGGIQQMARDFWADLMPTDSPNQRALTIALFVMCILFMIVLITSIVLGYETVEYDEFGVTHNLITGILDLKNPYSTGVYIVLPWKNMIKFDKTARYLNFRKLTVFTTDKASITLDATILYRIRPHQIEPIWLNFANEHERVLYLVAENIFRNHGNQFSIYDYRARREHVELSISRVVQQKLSGDCCPVCCKHQTCAKTIEYSCSKLTHCKNESYPCSNGYFVDIDAVYIFRVALPKQIIGRLHTLMLKPLFTETAESNENASLVRIETERQRNEYLNKAREVLMSALAKNELIKEKARVNAECKIINQTSTSEDRAFKRLQILNMAHKMSASFLLEMNHLANISQTVDLDTILTTYETSDKQKQTNDLFDFVPAANVFDITEFLSILEN